MNTIAPGPAATEMLFRLNLNGDTFDTFRKHNADLGEAIDLLEKALNTMHPHGRNYQVNPGPTEAHRHDVDMQSVAWDALRVLVAYRTAHTNQLVTQK